MQVYLICLCELRRMEKIKVQMVLMEEIVITTGIYQQVQSIQLQELCLEPVSVVRLAF